ncbi:MAG: hypothetical protein ACKN9U_20970 [Pirellulaceae bacterium]
MAAWLQKQQRQTIARRHPVEGGLGGNDAGARSLLFASRSLLLDKPHCGSIGYW